MYEKFMKRFFDFCLSFLALVLLSPIALMICIWIKCDSPGPVFFKQKRVGRARNLFDIYKFRSMLETTPSDCPTHLLKDPQKYITRSGRFLRKTSLDELPQLINILLGHMSFIGPRPALYNQDDLIAEREKYGVHKYRPGLSGWAQVNGRDELPIIEKVAFDKYYVDHCSLLFDIKILLKTITCVFRRTGVVEDCIQQDHVTIEQKDTYSGDVKSL